jgi:hypothetical protein
MKCLKREIIPFRSTWLKLHTSQVVKGVKKICATFLLIGANPKAVETETWKW